MKITVFTPLYNHAHLIDRLYQSLQRQNFTDFEWIVVDDGSSDHPEYLFNKWKTDNNPFGIHFLQTENGGKHRAINHGLALAHGDYFMVCDSDDYFTDDALSLVSSWIDEIKEESDLHGVVGLKVNTSGDFLLWHYDENGTLQKYGGTPPFSGHTDTTFAVYNEYGFLGDHVEIIRTSVFQQYPFPEFPGENFLSESIIWNRMAKDNLLFRFYDTGIMVCEYLDGGLTDLRLDHFAASPKGYALYLREVPYTAEEQLNAFSYYYKTVFPRLSEAEIAANLGITDCSYLRQYLSQKLHKRLDELSVMMEAVTLLKKIRAQQVENTSPLNSTLMEQNIYSLLQQTLSDSKEADAVMLSDPNLFTDKIRSAQEETTNELRQLNLN